MDTITLGDVEVARVYEHQGVRLPREFVFPGSDPALWRGDPRWVEQDFWDAGTDELLFNMQTWVLRSEGRTILVDTGIGDSKERPGDPVLHHRESDFLANLAAVGVAPEDVDVVVCTHVHGDHVGWNTRLVDGEWIPTFGNARYLIARADFDYWNPVNGHQTRLADIFADSVAPVHQAGLTDLWDDHYEIDANLRLEPAPGHTPGSAVLWLRSGSDRAAFVGDLLHTPVQVLEPDRNPCFGEDEARARATRRAVLDRLASGNALMLPAHLGGAGAAEVRAEGGGYTISGWAAFQ